MTSNITKVAREISRQFKPKNRFEKGIGAELPEAYRKFWREWKIMKPASVHYVPREGEWHRDEVTGETLPIQNVPIPLRFPAESDEGIWGGEGVIQGFQKRDTMKRRVPHFWVPILKRTVVRSDVLNTYLSVTVTDRTIAFINDHYGFDHYLLKTAACDLRSVLALKLKRKILQELSNGCPNLAGDPGKQEEIYNEYKDYLQPYTAEDIEWYGLTWEEAIKKISTKKADESKPVPLKHQFRRELIEKMKAAGIREASGELDSSDIPSSWLSKINPFAKKNEA